MDLFLPEIDVVHGEAENLADPHACPQKEKDQCPVPGIVYHFNEPFYILRIHRAGKFVGELQSDRFLQDRWGKNVLLMRKWRKATMEARCPAS